jgi:subtilase family serine protease
MVLPTNRPIGYPSADLGLHVTVGLPLRNRGELSQLIQQLQDRTSPQFGKYLTPKEFTDRYGPTEEDYQRVIDFARSNGLQIDHRHPNRTQISLRGSVSNLERAFQVRLQTFQHPTEARTFFAPDRTPTPNGSIPFLGVAGLTSIGPPRPASLHRLISMEAMKPIGQTGSDISGYYIGKDFRNAYLPGVTLDGSGQRVALVEFDGYYTNDISLYVKRAKLAPVALTNIPVAGYSAPVGANNLEVALDIEMAICMAPKLDAILVYEGNDPYEVLNQIANDNLARQISCSWIWLDPAGSAQLNQILLQYAVQGQSFFTASGDSGAWQGQIWDPVDSPWVTSVGGTTLSTSSPGGPYLSETVWNWAPAQKAASGGGVSTSNSLPNWQATVGAALGGPSANHRNVPDVALTADHIIAFYNNGSPGAVAGTSAAAPLWAGVAALINQQSSIAGAPALGFLNPSIYQIGSGSNYLQGFRDVQNGNNTILTNATKVYSALPGYDLCTGWGTPKAQGLIDLLSPPVPPTVTSSPVLQTVLTGGTAIFTATAKGTPPLTYRWRFGGNDVVGGISNSLMLANIQPSQAGDYWLVITNIAGATSNLVGTLVVPSPPRITVQPLPITVVSESSASFAIGVVGYTPLSLGWLRDGTSISGANSSNLTLPIVHLTDSGAKFSCLVTNIAGSILSQTALLTVLPSAGPGGSNDGGEVPLFGPFELLGFGMGLVLLGLRRHCGCRG